MDSYLVGYMLVISAAPILTVGVLWLARKDMARTITVLSALALGIGLLDAIVYTLTLKTAAGSQGLYSYGPIGVGSGFIDILPALEQGHTFALEVTSTLQTAAWVLTLYHAVQARRGRWLAIVSACAAFSLFMGFVASNVNFIGIIATNPQLSSVIVQHPYGMLFAINALAPLVAAATLLYAQVGMRAAKPTGLVPGAVVARAGEVAFAPLPPGALGDGAEDDAEEVEFVVERLPSWRG